MQPGEYPDGLGIEHHEHLLIAGADLDRRGCYRLCFIQLQLFSEHKINEILLQLFVGVVDAQLFEWIQGQYFESKDIQQPKHQIVFVFSTLIESEVATKNYDNNYNKN